MAIGVQEAIGAQSGTFARWLSDDQLMFQADPQDATAPWEWLLSPATGATRSFGFPTEAYRPAISPSGASVAFDEGDGTRPGILVFDTETREARKLAEGYVAPIWVGPDIVLASAGGACTFAEFCEIPWSTLGKTAAIDVRTGITGQSSLPTTLSEVARYGVIDVVLR